MVVNIWPALLPQHNTQFVSCFLTSLLQVDPAGAVVLSSGGDRSQDMLDALNAGACLCFDTAWGLL